MTYLYNGDRNWKQPEILPSIYAIKTRINYNKQLSRTTKCSMKLESLI